MVCGFQFDFLSLAIKHQQKKQNKLQPWQKEKTYNRPWMMMSPSVFYWFDGNKNIKRQNKINDKKMKNQWNVNKKMSKLHSNYYRQTKNKIKKIKLWKQTIKSKTRSASTTTRKTQEAKGSSALITYSLKWYRRTRN